MADSARGVIIMYGGHDATGPLTDIWQWDGRTWSRLESSGPTPGPRYQPAMVYGPRRQVTVLYGTLSGANRETREWDGLRWARR